MKIVHGVELLTFDNANAINTVQHATRIDNIVKLSIERMGDEQQTNEETQCYNGCMPYAVYSM